MAQSNVAQARAAINPPRDFTRKQSVLLLAFCVLLWSTSGLFVKLSTLNPVALAGGRSAITALVLLAYIRKPRFTFSRVQLLGAGAMTITFILFISATRMTNAANAILLQYTAPVWVALFGQWYLGEKTRAYDWWIMGAIVAGMLLFFGDKLSLQGMLGNIMALVSGVTMAWMTLFLRKEPESAGETILAGNLLTALVGVPVLVAALLAGTVAPVEWGIMLYMGIFQLGLAFILYTIAIRKLAALETILISTVEPILNPIWVFLVIGEVPGTMALIGGAIVLGAVTLRALIASGSLRWGNTPLPS